MVNKQLAAGAVSLLVLSGCSPKSTLVSENFVFSKSFRSPQEISSRSAQKIVKSSSVPSVSLSPSVKNPYRAMLTPSSTALYDEILSNIQSFQSEFSLNAPATTAQTEKAVKAVFFDHPELFWLDYSYQYSYNKNNMVTSVIIRFNDLAGDLSAATAALADVLRPVLTHAKSLNSVLDQEIYVHDFLIRHISYGEKFNHGQGIYSALVLGEASCAGYARAFQYIMLQLGVPTYYCFGETNDSHAWNIIAIDNSFYNVDVAWNDPIYSTDDSHPAYPVSSDVCRDYLNVSDEEISLTHTRLDEAVSLPPCP